MLSVFSDRDASISRHVSKRRDRSARPADFQRSHIDRSAQAEMKLRVVCRLIAHSALRFLYLCYARRHNSESCPDAVAIGPSADQPDFQPAVSISAIVAEKLRTLAIVCDQHVYIPVVIVIGESSGATDARSSKIAPHLASDVSKRTVHVAINGFRFGVSRAGVKKADVVEHVTIRNEQIGPSIVVVIEKACSKPTQLKCAGPKLR